jgi:hypothetical protein
MQNYEIFPIESKENRRICAFFAIAADDGTACAAANRREPPWHTATHSDTTAHPNH